MDSTYVAGLTEVNGLKTGWKLIRIPFSHFEKMDNILRIKYVRLVVSGVSQPTNSNR